ncbi:uncharacterized protein LOC105664590 [Ceratitis capitata]|uniref:uncharacterized protein LOC105664590 n=1 Tax=Ceratitis capitata TaxID=7213 RepID=UPI00061892AA|nr:uncharacterized protein LOC105664590 [Ceratitis capitata]
MLLEIQRKFTIFFSILSILLISPQITGRPLAVPYADAELIRRIQEIFVMDTGTAVYNITSLDEIVLCPGPNDGETYCREVISHSAKMKTIRSEQFDEFKDDFKDDLLPVEEVIASRMDIEEPVVETTCTSKSTLIYPESAQSKDGKWLLVVQQEDFKQGVLIEECASETTKCKQQFSYRNMVVLVGGDLKKEMVKLPSACECSLCAIEAQHG